MVIGKHKFMNISCAVVWGVALPQVCDWKHFSISKLGDIGRLIYTQTKMTAFGTTYFAEPELCFHLLKVSIYDS